jgi:hypothetical protein
LSHADADTAIKESPRCYAGIHIVEPNIAGRHFAELKKNLFCAEQIADVPNVAKQLDSREFYKKNQGSML